MSFELAFPAPQPDQPGPRAQERPGGGFRHNRNRVNVRFAAQNVDAEVIGARQIHAAAVGVLRPGKVETRPASGPGIQGPNPRQVLAGEITVRQRLHKFNCRSPHL